MSSTEVAAAQAVVEATVNAGVAGAEAVAASGAAIAAEGAAADALEAAREAEELAARAVDRAAIDSEARIRKFEEEMASCRTEISGLRVALTDMTAAHQSTSERLTRLSRLEELETLMTEVERAELVARRLAMSSATDGDTSGAGAGGAKPPAKPNDGPAPKDGESTSRADPETQAQESGEKPPQAPAGKHRWL